MGPLLFILILPEEMRITRIGMAIISQVLPRINLTLLTMHFLSHVKIYEDATTTWEATHPVKILIKCGMEETELPGACAQVATAVITRVPIRGIKKELAVRVPTPLTPTE